jgi:tetratricopeptide (TPR) repeat protein
LYYLDHQPTQAKLFLQKIPDQNNTVLQLQKNLIQLLILPDLMDIRSAQAKAEIVKNFAVIRNQSNLLDSTLHIYPKLMLYFSRLYHQKGDVVAAGLLHRRAMIVPTNGGRDWSSDYYAAISYFDRFASLKDMDDLIALAQKKVRSSFEKFLTDTLSTPEKIKIEPWDDSPRGPINTLPTIEQLYDLKGTIAFRQNRLKVALTTFEQLPETYWRDTYDFSSILTYNPFADSQTFPWQGKRWDECNKLAIVKRMIELQDQSSKKGPQQAESAYLLANAYFNTSYWGRSWMMNNYGKSATDCCSPPSFVPDKQHTFHPNSAHFFKVYFQLSRAIAYYQKVIESNPNFELAARATYMLGYCEEYSKIANGELEEQYDSRDDKPYISSIFSTFRKKFGQTLAFQECLKTCPELADYFKTR